jgi:hypothetical protein
MQLDLDSDLSEQLKDCKPDEKVTLSATVLSNDGSTVQVDIDTATSDKYAEGPGESEGGGVVEGQSGEPVGPEEQPALPGPVKMLLKRR